MDKRSTPKKGQRSLLSVTHLQPFPRYASFRQGDAEFHTYQTVFRSKPLPKSLPAHVGIRGENELFTATLGSLCCILR